MRLHRKELAEELAVGKLHCMELAVMRLQCGSPLKGGCTAKAAAEPAAVM